MPIADLLAAIPADERTILLPDAAEWRQGRTLYGGASALLAYAAATRAFADLPPLRSGQVAFVAPVGESLAFRTKIVRRGRNVAQVRSEILSDGEVALSAFFLFGEEREANAVHRAPRMEQWPGAPEDATPVPADKGPDFLRNNMDVRFAQDRGQVGPVIRRWIRLRQRDSLDPVGEMVLLGDSLPAGAARAMQRRGPISSINWSFNLLDSAPCTRGGWWLAETASDHADSGYSSERLRLWNADGEQMLAGMQAVAIFG